MSDLLQYAKTKKVRKEERWMREKELGRGSSGVVWLERCIQGDSEGKVRAVKKVEKLKSSDYYRELEAIALFSLSKYERCFVKSFGWYDNSDSIFITMEYLSDGDLHKYLGSPLPENEGQQIVSQVVEGLHFMHDKGFAHRDLKPANILIVHKGPDWWVKIADFGISKRATEGLTALRTLTGTPAFAAPEVLGFVQSDDRLNDSYTNAVDIWSLGVITFLILTGETLFKDLRRLYQYAAGSYKFPLDVLLANKLSEQGCDFIKSSMAPKSEDRLSAEQCLQHPWVDFFIEDAASHTQREFNISDSMPIPLDDSDPEPSVSWSTQDTISNSMPLPLDDSVPEPSASWSTQDTILNYKAHSSTGVLAEKAISASMKAVALSTSKPATQVYWHAANILRGHLNSVNAMTFSPDGKQIASASMDKMVRLWDSATGEPRNILKGHSNWVKAVTFSPDGKQIASASHDKTVRLWDSATGEPRNILKGHSDQIQAVTFSPDWELIAFASYDNTVRLWDSPTGEPRIILKGHSGWVEAVTFSPDGKQIASTSKDKTIRLWDSATGEPRNILKGHSGRVVAVTFSPDGKQIASASWDKTVTLWNSTTEAPPPAPPASTASPAAVS
ncbi:hypothetical protein MMC22_007922 [Lobaria immixta]|nr:hypothetical protein [Lobaria immixta]